MAAALVFQGQGTPARGRLQMGSGANMSFSFPGWTKGLDCWTNREQTLAEEKDSARTEVIHPSGFVFDSTWALCRLLSAT